jgi:hypothetical protein
MFVEGKGDLGLLGQPRTFQNDLGAQLSIGHGQCFSSDEHAHAKNKRTEAGAAIRRPTSVVVRD